MRASEWLGRLALVPLGLVIALVALEVVLQLGALALALTGATPSFGERGSRRILCLGDSNTYGVWLKNRDTEAWPPQLEALWNEAHPSDPIEVLNAGYPGTSSSHLLGQLPALLDAFEPDQVIVMVGVNDSWTEPVPLDRAEGGPLAWLRRRSRVLRLARLLRPRLEAADLEVIRQPGEGGQAKREHGAGVVRFGEHEFPMEWKKATSGRKGAWEALGRNLRTMVERSRERGVPIALTTYPSSHGPYGRANLAIRTAARDSGATLIDLAEVFSTLCPREACPEWLYKDQHPRERGYRLVAETIAARLQAQAP